MAYLRSPPIALGQYMIHDYVNGVWFIGTPTFSGDVAIIDNQMVFRPNARPLYVFDPEPD